MHPIRKRTRKLNYDYSQNNLYFVTGNVKHFKRCLGEVVNGKMILNEYGVIVNNQIEWLEQNYKYVILHATIVMPNHWHFILEINNEMVDETVKIKSLSELVGAFKSTSSKMIHDLGFAGFIWHRSFHDHIIRDDAAYQKICNYIEANPEKWSVDKFYKN